MKVQKLSISSSCEFTLTTFEAIEHKSVCLEYTERSPDHWHSDTETSIDIDADKAREIVEFMRKAFLEIAPQDPEPEQPAQQEPVGHGGRPMTLRECMEAEQPAQQEPVIECDCETATSPDGKRKTKCGSDQMRRAVKEGHAFVEQLAQQEPVAYMNPEDLEKMKRFGRGSVAWATPTDFCTQPVYTRPQAREPLTDEEIWKNDKIMAANSGYGATFDTLRELTRAIEAAHGIKGGA